MEKDESASPTVGIDSVLVTTAIKAAKGRDVATVDLSSAYLSADMNNDEEEVHMVLFPPSPT